MKKRERKALGRYIRWIADEMGLRDWTFNLEIDIPQSPSDDPDGARWGASCLPIPGRKVATITIAPSQRKASREDLRQTVVHELTHCHFYGVWDTVRRDLLTPLGQQTYDLFVAGIERHMEYGVDAMADTLAPHMPLIDWDEK